MMIASRRLIFYYLGLTLVCCLGLTHAIPINEKPEVATEFIILHNNDMHSRFEQITADGEKCREEKAKENKCYGGFARVAHEVRKYREEAKNGGTPVFYLNAGDTYTGTLWFSIHKEKIAYEFLNKLQPDAASLGNHEFDGGVEGLVPFLRNVEFPIVAANLDLSSRPALTDHTKLCNSTILEVNGVKIGIVGYITPDTVQITKSNDMIILDEIESINQESARLKEEGINIIIALGHSGYSKDKEIAAQCSDVDLVIGGHTNTFLYNGEQPDTERINGPYPTVVEQTSGKQVPVVQAFAYTKYLGKLHVKFDKDGNLIEFDGSPILLNAEVPRDEDVLELLESYRPRVRALETQVIGKTRVKLNGRDEICRSQECNLGNLITDAMVHARVLENLGGAYWTDAAIAFMQGGGIRSSIVPYSDGLIFAADAIRVLPHNNTLRVTRIRGKTILAALEHSASMVGKDSDGGFLQMSGVHTTYDYNNEEGSRVVSAEVLCAACNMPTYEPLVADKMYNVIVTDYLWGNRDGHKFREDDGIEAEQMQTGEHEAVYKYLKRHDVIYPAVEGRIKIIQKTEGDGNKSNGADEDGDSMSANGSDIPAVVPALAALVSSHLNPVKVIQSMLD